MLSLGKSIDGKHHWVHSIKKLKQNLLNLGLVEKGLKAELCTRVVLVLSRD